MNRKQTIALVIASVIILVMGLFPPYLGEFTAIRFSGFKRFLGYESLFTPPTPQAVYRIMTNDWITKMSEIRSLSRYSAKIDISRLGVQITVLVIAAAGFVLAFKENK